MATPHGDSLRVFSEAVHDLTQIASTSAYVASAVVELAELARVRRRLLGIGDTEQVAAIDERLEQVSEILNPAPPAPPAALTVPTVVDAPYVEQDSTILNCSLGNWTGEPTSRTYQWQRDGSDVGMGGSTYYLTVDDTGKVFACTQTASNAAGASAPVTSNAVIVEVASALSNR